MARYMTVDRAKQKKMPLAIRTPTKKTPPAKKKPVGRQRKLAVRGMRTGPMPMTSSSQAPPPPPPVVSKKRESRVEAEIKRLQESTELILPKSRFELLVRELCQDLMTDLRFEKDFFAALQEAAEKYLVDLFEKTGKLAEKSNRPTIKKEDMQFILELFNGKK